MPPETWERTRQVNLDGAFYITQGGLAGVYNNRVLTTYQIKQRWRTR